MRYKVQAVVAVLLSAAIWNGEGMAQGDVDIVSCSAEALWVMIRRNSPFVRDRPRP